MGEGKKLVGKQSHAKISTLAEQELVNSLSWLITLRWLAGVGMLLAAWFTIDVLGLNLPARPVYALGVGILMYNALLWWGLGQLNATPSFLIVVYQWFARFQIGLDWAAMTLLIYFSGGIESPALFYFLFHITIASLLLPHDRGFLYVTLAPILVGGVAFLEYQGVLPHIYLFETSRYNNLFYVAGVLFFFTSAAYVMAYFSMTISQRLRRREDELAGLYQSVQAATSTLEISDVLNRLAEATTKALRCKAVTIRLLNKSGHLEISGSYGLSELYLNATSVIELTQARIDQETLAGQAVLVSDVLRDDRSYYPDEMAAEGIETILSTPLIGKQGPIGVLRAYGGSTYHFAQDNVAFLAAIATEGVVAIENAQTYQVLKDLDKHKSQFVHNVTHELRSPTRVVASLLNVLSRDYVGDLNEKQADLVDRIQQRIQFLQTLIDDLLDLAVGKADVLITPERAKISLTDILKEVQSRFEAPARDKGLILRLDYPAEAVNLWGDKNELDRIINNLVSNAITYTQKGEVSLLLEQSNDAVRLVVTDTGIGIPKEAQSHLFEEFYRAKNAKEMISNGTGLGLSIVKDLVVERYGGKIEVESIEHQGTTFTLQLKNIS